MISALPFSDSEDTTQAENEASNAEFGTACAHPEYQFTHTVWYNFTPSTDQAVVVNTSGSNYHPVIAAATGQPGNFASVTCYFDSIEFVATAGVTYHIGVAEFGNSGGGTLDFSVTGRPGPVFTVDRSGIIDSSTGTVTLTGSVSCPAGFSPLTIGGTLSQRVDGSTVSDGNFIYVTSCGAVPQPWSFTIPLASYGRPGAGEFKAGHAKLGAVFRFCDQNPGGLCAGGVVVTSGAAEVTRSITLRP